MQPRLLAIDFDGVLCDSTEECIVTAWNAWQNSPNFVRDSAEVPEPFQSALRAHRNYVRTAGEYLILIEGARLGRAIASQNAYDKLFEEFGSAIKPYGERFFSARDRLRAEDELHWLALHTVYPGIPDDLHKLWDNFAVFVVTGKDSKSVQMFFERFDLPIPPAQVYGKDAAHDKLSAIRMIAANLGQPLNSAVFVDDNIHHLLPAHEAGCRAFLAGWGYHTLEQLELAKQKCVPILDLETWAEALLQPGVTA